MSHDSFSFRYVHKRQEKSKEHTDPRENQFINRKEKDYKCAALSLSFRYEHTQKNEEEEDIVVKSSICNM